MTVAGVDGCHAGWAVVHYEPETGAASVAVVPTFADLLAHTARTQIVAVDMPIGLLDAAVAGGRDCDREARRLLGRPRGSSVFSPPSRAAFGHATYRAALAAQRAASPSRTGFSIQAWHILPKIRQVDDAMTPALQERVVEVHPELSFRALNGGAPCARKKTAAGRARRVALLLGAGFASVSALLEAVPRRAAAVDDLLDACAAAWSAARVRSAADTRIPADPSRDARGLRMEIRF